MVRTECGQNRTVHEDRSYLPYGTFEGTVGQSTYLQQLWEQDKRWTTRETLFLFKNSTVSDEC
jgi:hypothetical protein